MFTQLFLLFKEHKNKLVNKLFTEDGSMTLLLKLLICAGIATRIEYVMDN